MGKAIYWVCKAVRQNGWDVTPAYKSLSKDGKELHSMV